MGGVDLIISVGGGGGGGGKQGAALELVIPHVCIPPRRFLDNGRLTFPLGGEAQGECESSLHHVCSRTPLGRFADNDRLSTHMCQRPSVDTMRSSFRRSDVSAKDADNVDFKLSVDYLISRILADEELFGAGMR